MNALIFNIGILIIAPAELKLMYDMGTFNDMFQRLKSRCISLSAFFLRVVTSNVDGCKRAPPISSRTAAALACSEVEGALTQGRFT